MLEPRDKVPFRQLKEAEILSALFKSMCGQSVERAIDHYRLFLQNHITRAKGRQKYILTCWSERALRHYIDTSVLRADLSEARFAGIKKFIYAQLSSAESVSELLGMRTMLIHYVMHRYPAHYRPFTSDEVRDIEKKTGKKPLVPKKRVDYVQARQLIWDIDRTCDQIQPALEAHLGPPEGRKKSAGLMLFTAEHEPFVPGPDEDFSRWFKAPYQEKSDLPSDEKADFVVEKPVESKLSLQGARQTLFSAFESLAQQIEREGYNINAIATRFNYYLAQVCVVSDTVILVKQFDADKMYFDSQQEDCFNHMLTVRLARENEQRSSAMSFDGPS